VRRSALVCVTAACLSTAALAQQVQTNGEFTRFHGGAFPQGGSPPAPLPELQTYVNGTPVPASSPPVVVGNEVQGELLLPTGTTSVEFKNGDGVSFGAPSLIAFAPAQSPVPSDPTGAFLFGVFTITNGISSINEVNFDVTFTTVSDDPAFDGHTFSDTLRYVVTPNNLGSDFDAADQVSFINHPGVGIVHVYEAFSPFGGSGTIELWGRIGSLDPLFFANGTGGVSLEPLVAVPEPAGWLLMLMGPFAIATAIARRRNERPRWRGALRRAARS